MSPSILPITESDLPVLSEHLLICKLRLAINRFLWKDWPNVEAQRPQYANAIKGGFQDPNTENLKIVNASGHVLLAYAALTRKNGKGRATPEEAPPKEDAKQDADAETANKDEGGVGGGVPKDLVPEVLDEVILAVGELNEDWEEFEHFALTYIFVAPAQRKKGLGAQLVKLCMDKARAEGLPLALQSEPAAHDFFSKMGFEDTKHVDFDLVKWGGERCGYGVFTLWGMKMGE